MAPSISSWEILLSRSSAAASFDRSRMVLRYCRRCLLISAIGSARPDRGASASFMKNSSRTRGSSAMSSNQARTASRPASVSLYVSVGPARLLDVLAFDQPAFLQPAEGDVDLADVG